MGVLPGPTRVLPMPRQYGLGRRAPTRAVLICAALWCLVVRRPLRRVDCLVLTYCYVSSRMEKKSWRKKLKKVAEEKKLQKKVAEKKVASATHSSTVRQTIMSAMSQQFAIRPLCRWGDGPTATSSPFAEAG